LYIFNLQDGLPDNYDAEAKRQYRLDLFLHGRDDTVLEQQFMTKSTTGYTSKPLGPGADRFMLQPYSRYTNASRFAGETDGFEAIESVAKAYPIDRNRIFATGLSNGGMMSYLVACRLADRIAASAVAPSADQPLGSMSWRGSPLSSSRTNRTDWF